MYTKEYLTFEYELSVRTNPKYNQYYFIIIIIPRIIYKLLTCVAYGSISEPTKNYINASKRFIYMAYQN